MTRKLKKLIVLENKNKNISKSQDFLIGIAKIVEGKRTYAKLVSHFKEAGFSAKEYEILFSANQMRAWVLFIFPQAFSIWIFHYLTAPMSVLAIFYNRKQCDKMMGNSTIYSCFMLS